MSWRREQIVRPALEALLAGLDPSVHVAQDPVRFVHRYRRAQDQELVGLFAAALAYGRQDLFGPKLESALAALGPAPARLCAELAPREIMARLPAGWLYRMTDARDVAALLSAAARMQKKGGSLGAVFARKLRESPGDLRAAAAAWRAELLGGADVRELYGARAIPRRLKHLVPDPAGAGACKRLLLYLRWMVRGPDQVDLGLWKDVPTSLLVIPVDTHIARMSFMLGLTRRRSLTWITAEEITRKLRILDPADPVKYDFALCHMGMSGDWRTARLPYTRRLA